MTEQNVNFNLYFNNTQESYLEDLDKYIDEHLEIYLFMFSDLKWSVNFHKSNQDMEDNDDYQRLKELIYKPNDTFKGFLYQTNKINKKNLQMDQENLNIAFNILQRDEIAKKNERIKLNMVAEKLESYESMVFYIPEDDLINNIHELNGFYQLQSDKLVNSQPYWKRTKTINSNGEFVGYKAAPYDDIYMYYKIEGSKGKPYLCISSNKIFKFTEQQETSSFLWSDFVNKLKSYMERYSIDRIQQYFNENHAGYAYIYRDYYGLWKYYYRRAQYNIIEFNDEEYFMDKIGIFYGTGQEYLDKKQSLKERKKQYDDKQAAEKALEEAEKKAEKAKQDEKQAKERQKWKERFQRQKKEEEEEEEQRQQKAKEIQDWYENLPPQSEAVTARQQKNLKHWNRGKEYV